MANIKISELEEYTEAKDSDLLVIVDTTNNETKKIENFNLSKNKLDKTSIKNIKTNSDENIYSCNYVNTAIGSLDDLKTIDKSSVVNSINEIDNRFTYSTDERVIGKWKNGKPLYEKTITFTDFERNGRDTYKEHNIPNVDLAFINFSKSFGTQPSGETIVGNYAYNTVYSFQINGANRNAILYNVGSSIAMSTITVTLDYTKTTDSATNTTEVINDESILEKPTI